jgi:hypothetical protein
VAVGCRRCCGTGEVFPWGVQARAAQHGCMKWGITSSRATWGSMEAAYGRRALHTSDAAQHAVSLHATPCFAFHHTAPSTPPLACYGHAMPSRLQDANYEAATRLAFDLKHPGRLLAALQRAGVAGGAAAGVLSGLVAHMQPDDLRTALEYCRCGRGPGVEQEGRGALGVRRWAGRLLPSTQGVLDCTL